MRQANKITGDMKYPIISPTYSGTAISFTLTLAELNSQLEKVCSVQVQSSGMIESVKLPIVLAEAS